MAITGINNSSCTSYYASNYKNTVKKTDSEKDSTRCATAVIDTCNCHNPTSLLLKLKIISIILNDLDI